MTNNATKTYRITVIERALAFYEVEAENPRAAAEDWPDGEFLDRDDETLDTEGPSSVRERQPDGTWRKVPPSEWQDAPATASDTAEKPYSVLLLYPDDVNDSGTETYYAFVEAPDAIEAVAMARREAVAAQEECAEHYEPNDFVPLLVIAGHHDGQPMSNQ